MVTEGHVIFQTCNLVFIFNTRFRKTISKGENNTGFRYRFTLSGNVEQYIPYVIREKQQLQFG